jgi:cation diffusion facilitator family transporter
MPARIHASRPRPAVRTHSRHSTAVAADAAGRDGGPPRPSTSPAAQVLRAARLSLAAGAGLLALKAAAWWLTGSVALLADALESIVNVAAAAAAAYALQVARRPPDARHPFGHAKAEYLSAVLEGVLVLLAAGGIARAAWHQLVAGGVPGELGLGAALAAAAALGNAALALHLRRVGRAAGSPALLAGAAHLWGDVATTAGVLLGLGAAWATGWWVLDPLVGLLVAVNVVHLGWQVVRESVGGLMDESLPRADLARVEAAIRREMVGALQFHDLRTRRAGPRVFVELHLVVPGAMRVDAAHAICDRIEDSVRREVPGALAVVHVEPEAELEPS